MQTALRLVYGLFGPALTSLSLQVAHPTKSYVQEVVFFLDENV